MDFKHRSFSFYVQLRFRSGEAHAFFFFFGMVFSSFWNIFDSIVLDYGKSILHVVATVLLISQYDGRIIYLSNYLLIRFCFISSSKKQCDKYFDEQPKYQLCSTKFNHECKKSANCGWLLKRLRSGPRSCFKKSKPKEWNMVGLFVLLVELVLGNSVAILILILPENKLCHKYLILVILINFQGCNCS